MAFPSRKNAKRDFENHLKSHEPRKEHICQFCKKKFEYKSFLQRHTETCRMKTKIQKLQNPKPKKRIASFERNLMMKMLIIMLISDLNAKA